MFQPLEASCMSDWGLLDWARFVAVKHSMDALLVGVIHTHVSIISEV